MKIYFTYNIIIKRKVQKKNLDINNLPFTNKKLFYQYIFSDYCKKKNKIA